MAAAIIYFVPESDNLQAYVTIYETRIWVDPYAAHGFSAVLALVAFIILPVYLVHMKTRHNLCIASEPGSIAASAAVLSQSKFARTLIRANMTEKEIGEVVRGMRFGFDMRTWAIEAEGYNAEDYSMYAAGEGFTPGQKDVDERDAEQTGLLASQQMEMAPYVPAYPPTPSPPQPDEPEIELRPSRRSLPSE